MKLAPLFSVCVMVAVAMPACSKPAPESQAQVADADAASRNLVDYRNGLSDADRQTFYHLPEGSEIIPVALLQALDRRRTPQDAPGDGPIAFTENLARYGFIPDSVHPQNPFGLPVGMTVA